MTGFPTVHVSAKIRTLFVALPLLLSFSLFAQRSPDRIVGRIDPGHMVKLKGSLHPKARPENDLGAVTPNLNLDYVTLQLQQTPAQQADLASFLAQLQNPASPNYHKWLTPEQYADRFGSSPADIAQIAGWLKDQGLTVISTARGRNFLVFKGTAATVEAALHVEIHRFLVDGEMHYANATEPAVPAALHPVTLGFLGLDDFKPRPSPQSANPVPALSYRGQNVLSPGDLWVIYDTVPFYLAGLTGNGMKIAVVGQSNVNLSDIATYQSDFGLPSNPPVKMLIPGS